MKYYKQIQIGIIILFIATMFMWFYGYNSVN